MTDEIDFGQEAKPRRWAGLVARASDRANAAEVRFLGLLRGTALVIAALVLLSGAILLGLGAARQLGRTQVDPKTVSVSAEDIVPAIAEPTKAAVKPAPAKPGIGADTRKRTLEVYQTRFKAYQRPDTKVTEKQVVDFVWSEDRITAFADLEGEQLLDKEGKPLAERDAIIRNALDVVDVAAQKDAFQKQLSSYRDAKKVNVCTDKVRTRTRTVDGWDSYATHCQGWYISPVGCSITRRIEEPYTEKVCEMKFPDDLEAPAQQFASAVDRYLEQAQIGLRMVRNDAETQTARNNARKQEGLGNIVDGGKLFIGFLILMFLYLFIAMERHHRNLRALMERTQRSDREHDDGMNGA